MPGTLTRASAQPQTKKPPRESNSLRIYCCGGAPLFPAGPPPFNRLVASRLSHLRCCLCNRKEEERERERECRRTECVLRRIQKQGVLPSTHNMDHPLFWSFVCQCYIWILVKPKAVPFCSIYGLWPSWLTPAFNPLKSWLILGQTSLYFANCGAEKNLFTGLCDWQNLLLRLVWWCFFSFECRVLWKGHASISWLRLKMFINKDTAGKLKNPMEAVLSFADEWAAAFTVWWKKTAIAMFIAAVVPWFKNN